MLNCHSVQSLTKATERQNIQLNENLRPPFVRRADDGLDRPALPLPASAVRAACAAVHGDDRRGGDRARRCRSGCSCTIRPSTRSRCSWAAAIPRSSPRRRASAQAAGYAEINLNVGCPERSGAKRLLRRLPDAAARAGRGVRAAHAATRCGCPSRSSAASASIERDDYEFFADFAADGGGRRGGCAHRACARRDPRRPEPEGEPRDSAAQVRLCAAAEARAPGICRGPERRSGRRCRGSPGLGGGARRRHARPRGLPPAAVSGRARAGADRFRLADSRARGRSSSAWCPMRGRRPARACACTRSRATCTA